jgi:peptidoglycan/xylan/chitin deacetylase (PgdA/CDA1 family)
MDSSWPLVSRAARRRWTAVVVVAVAALGLGAIVSVGHGHGATAPRPTPVRVLPQWQVIQPHPTLPFQMGWRRHPGPVPILMYHVIERPRGGVANPLLYVSGRTFAAQMRWLDRHGFHAVTLDQVEDAWTRGGLLPRRPIVVSFDDGYRSHSTTAMPILRRHHWPGVLSLTLGNMNEPGDPLTPGRVQKLIDAGWEIDSHTISHIDLRGISRGRLRHELRDSRRILRYVFRVPVDNFTYPAGLHDRRAVAAVRAAGYRGAMGVAPGLASPRHPFELRRIRVIEDMHVRGLGRQLKALGV